MLRTSRPIRSALIALVALCSVGPAHGKDRTAVCTTVATCIERVHRVADPSDGITSPEDAVTDALHALGLQAIEPVIQLLQDPNENVRQLAGYILRDMPGLRPEHLDALERAVEAGDGWLPPAIASVGTPRAIRFLVDQVAKNPEMDTQLTVALERLGPRAFPELLELFRCEAECDERVLTTVGRIFSEQGERAAGVVDPLARIAADDVSSPVARRSAVRALGYLNATARPAVATLLEINRHGSTELRTEASRAVLAIGGPGTREVLEQTLERGDDKVLALLEIARLGERGREMGPSIERYLLSGDPDVRLAAAEALGMIGYRASRPSLAAALEDADDWRLVYVAARSLGLLRAADASAALLSTSKSHWYPPVRAAARSALRLIESPQPPATSSGRRESPSIDEVFDYEHAGRDFAPCADRAHFPARPQPSAVLDPTAEPDLARQLAYEREVVGWDEKGRHATRHRTIPEAGLRVGAGWLLGTDAGEWGGELVLRSDDGVTRLILGKNLKALHLLEDGRVVAVTGLAHMSMVEGAVYLVDCPSARECAATRWKQLPGAPRSSWITNEGGELLVNTTGGSVVISLDGRMRMADCHASTRSTAAPPRRD